MLSAAGLFTAFLCCTRLGATSAQGRFIYHEFNVRYFEGAPNGVRKQVLGVNGEFPGPTIHAMTGDFLEVKVVNNIHPKENTSIHWHGLEQYQVPFEDGPEYVTQCPIMYGHSMTYRFQLVQAGTYWWHSHHAWQYTEGCWGAIIIKNRTESYADLYSAELTIALSDWFNLPVADITEWYLSRRSQGNLPYPDSVLINGAGLYPCDAARAQGFVCNESAQGFPVFNVTRGATCRIRVVNTAAAITTTFSIDNHKLRVIEVDGVDTLLDIGPPVDMATLAPAQRYSFLVTMNGGTEDKFWIRVKAIDMPPIMPPNSNLDPYTFDPNARAVLQYIDPGVEQNFIPIQISPPVIIPTQGRPPIHDRSAWWHRVAQFGNSTRSLTQEYSLATVLRPVTSGNLPSTIPARRPVQLREGDCRPVGMAAPRSYTQNFTLEVFREKQRDGSFRWSFNRRIYTMSRNHEPALYQVLKPKQVEIGYNPIDTEVGRGKVIQVVINNPMGAPHPFHLHGHTAWVVGKGAAGAGRYDEKKHRKLLRVDGVRRDTVLVEGNSYVVLRYYADNPGTWLLHCHINWHLHAGLGMVFVEGKSQIRGFARIPKEWEDVCRRSGINLGSGRSNPVGSTACSEWPPRSGYCWRYCSGTSGKWCYTGTGCTDGGNQEMCADKTTCAAVGCGGAGGACVDSCPAVDSATPPPPVPNGSTGCSKKYTTGNGWCWRYCSGSNGPWCYTGNDCLKKEGVCADRTTCSGSCEGANPGCVLNCLL